MYGTQCNLSEMLTQFICGGRESVHVQASHGPYPGTTCIQIRVQGRQGGSLVPTEEGGYGHVIHARRKI